jgi:anti-sigma B factor antagonist
MSEPVENATSAVATQHVHGRYFVIALRGEWDLYNRPELEAALRAAAEAAERLVVLDLSRATFIDSSVLGALVESRKHLDDAVQMAVVAEDHQIRKVFEITGLDQVFALHETFEAATVTPQST